MTPKILSKAAKARLRRALEYEEGAFEKLKTTPELHCFAQHWDWDGGFEPLQQIIRDPRCDQGTALLIYWRAAPGWFCQYADREEVIANKDSVDVYALIQEIEARYLNGFYERHNIGFNPRNTPGGDSTRTYADIKRKRTIPGVMLQPSPGDELECRKTEIYDLVVRPLTDKERMRVDKGIAQALSLLGGRINSEETDPGRMVRLLEQRIDEARSDKGKLPEAHIDTLSETFGYLWADQVCRAHGWKWMVWAWPEGARIGISPPGIKFIVFPSTHIRHRFSDFWAQPGRMYEYYEELGNLNSLPKPQLASLASHGWIFVVPSDVPAQYPSEE